MATEWIGIINAGIPKYLRYVEALIYRDRILLAMLKNRGRVTFNNSGYECEWRVRYKQPPVTTYADGNTISFARRDKHKKCTTDWRGYKVTDEMTRKEKLMLKRSEDIVKRYDNVMPDLMEALQDTFCGRLFVNGNAAGYTEDIHGILSFMDQGTCAATDTLCQPSDTYAGLNTAVSTYGGSWTSNLSTYPNATIDKDWPDGTGDTHYDFFSPKIINYSSTNWGTNSSTAWEDNGPRAIRQAKTWVRRSGGKAGVPDLCLLSGDLMVGFKNSNEPKLDINVPHKESQDLGFPDALNFEGLAIKDDYDVPAGDGFLLNLDKMELASLDAELFHSEGPERDPRTDSFLFQAGFWGNCRWQPKYFAHFDAVA